MVKEEEPAPPPAPPLSPPSVVETTTIGKYIARFRYEKPQPRETRAAAQRSDFWWTKSPRYSLSPFSPPSTWASGGVFAFPNEEDEEENDLTEAKTEEKQVKLPVEDDGESVDSVESKLRHRVGLQGNESRHGTSDNREELSPAKSPAVLQSWSSMDWGSVDLEEIEEENEDPEEVIERVRRRLGWGATTSGISSSTASRLKPVEFRLSIDAREERRDTGRRQLGRKPPLSPGFIEYGMGLERDGGGDRFEEVSLPSCSADAKNTLAMEGTDEEKRSAVAEYEEKISLRSATETSDHQEWQSVHDELPSAEIAAEGLRSRSSSVASQSSQVSKPHDNALTVLPVDERLAGAPSAASPILDTSERNVAIKNQGENSPSPDKKSEHDAADAVAEPLLIPTVSPVRPDLSPELASPPLNDHLSERSEDSSSPGRREELVPIETTKTLDNLVSLVVHSWENDFFSTSESKEVEPTDHTQEQATEPREDSNCINDTPVSPTQSLPTTPSNGINEDKEATDYPITKEDVPTRKPKEESTQYDPDDEEKEDVEVPGEEDDQIVQMLLGRISLLEKALRQIDS